MKRYRDMYRHLETQSNNNVNIEFNMNQLAKMVEDCNYGTQRFLGFLIDYRRERYEKMGWTFQDKLSDEIEKLLNEGCY